MLGIERVDYRSTEPSIDLASIFWLTANSRAATLSISKAYAGPKTPPELVDGIKLY